MLRNIFFDKKIQQMDRDGYFILEGKFDPLNLNAKLREECVTAINEKNHFGHKILQIDSRRCKSDFPETKH